MLAQKYRQPFMVFWRWENEVASMEKIVQLCLELGINTFDHADRYGNYSCEKTFGELISSGSVQRSEIILFSKCGICLPNAARPDIRVKHVNTSADHISNSVENSLRNLKTDYLDVFIGSVGPSFRSRINSLGLGEIEKLRKSKKHWSFEFFGIPTSIAGFLFKYSGGFKSHRFKFIADCGFG